MYGSSPSIKTGGSRLFSTRAISLSRGCDVPQPPKMARERFHNEKDAARALEIFLKSAMMSGVLSPMSLHCYLTCRRPTERYLRTIPPLFQHAPECIVRCLPGMGTVRPMKAVDMVPLRFPARSRRSQAARETEGAGVSPRRRVVTRRKGRACIGPFAGTLRSLAGRASGHPPRSESGERRWE